MLVKMVSGIVASVILANNHLLQSWEKHINPFALVLVKKKDLMMKKKNASKETLQKR